MFSEFVKKSMSKARYELLSIEEWYYWEIPWYEWVWANWKDIDECKRELQEVFEEWISIKITKKLIFLIWTFIV